MIGVSEGGETSSVIGTVLAAADLENMKGRVSSASPVYFVYNNPDEQLQKLKRSKDILDHPLISKIPLVTGPQALTGSTRMQATTAETFVLGAALENAIFWILRPHLSDASLATLGFSPSLSLTDRLLSFVEIQKTLLSATPILARLVDLETQTYKENRFATYFAGHGLMTVFIDSTERSPTFNLNPLDSVSSKRRYAWNKIWSPTKSADEAWQLLLGRPFHGLDPKEFAKPFEQKIADKNFKAGCTSEPKKSN